MSFKKTEMMKRRKGCEVGKILGPTFGAGAVGHVKKNNRMCVVNPDAIRHMRPVGPGNLGVSADAVAAAIGGDIQKERSSVAGEFPTGGTIAKFINTGTFIHAGGDTCG